MVITRPLRSSNKNSARSCNSCPGRSDAFRTILYTNHCSTKPISPLLKQALPASDAVQPDSKRPRLSDVPEDDTIGKRISSDFYTSIDQVRVDLSRLQDAIKAINNPATVNGESKDDALTPNTLQEASTKIEEILSLDDLKPKPSIHTTGQVITLRSQTEKGTQQLYSGLQLEDSVTGQIKRLDGRRLPNGFDLTDPATMDTSLLAPTKDRRTFGDVFRPPSSLKQLDVPRSTRSTFRGNTLTFSKDSSLDKPQSGNRNDYRSQQLPVGSWLSYNLSDHQSDKRLRGRSLAQGDLRAALLANDLASQDTEDASSLFKKAYSSFAPTFDTSKAVVTEHDRDRQWFSKNGPRKLRAIFKRQISDDPSEPTSEIQGPDDDFATVVSNFEPQESDQIPPPSEEVESIDDILADLSSLLNTLHSQQQLRSLDTRPSHTTAKPPPQEIDTYDLLLNQFTILVSGLPPFAVAKLDGDKLAALNISTQVLVDTPDYRGTAQPDEFTLSRYRAAQATTAAARPQPQPQSQPARPTYSTPGVQRYTNTNSLSAYAQNLGVAAARYGTAATATGTNYQTPNTIQRPFQQSQYTGQTSSATYNASAALQQFQRNLAQPATPTANGYQYGGQQQTAPPPSGLRQTFMQSPSQPGYQQSAQNKVAYPANTGMGVSMGSPGTGLRSPSPAKPMGQPAYYGQQQQPVGHSLAQGQGQSMVNGS